MIYLDHNATTPLDSRVLDAMMPYLTEKFGNASSLDHSYGYDASVAVEAARDSVANAIGARHDEIIFTSGATESNNLALAGTMSKNKQKGNHIITCTTEHKAVLDTVNHLEKHSGRKATLVPVDEYGKIDLGKLEDAITDQTVMISAMAANNEVGTIADVSKIGKIAHDHDILFHTDAAQAVGHIPLDVQKMNIDMMSISAHKMYGPKGIGALYIRGVKPRVRMDSIMHGGGQERNIRSGTLNVPGIVGLGKAVDIAVNEMNAENKKFRVWFDKMWASFEQAGAKLNGHKTDRLPCNINVCFPGIESKAIINSISKQIAISAGSACTAQTVEPSHVILALGHDEDRAHSSVRIGMGRFNTEDEVNHCTETVVNLIQQLKSITN